MIPAPGDVVWGIEVTAALFLLQFYGNKLCGRRDILVCGRLLRELCASIKVARHNEVTAFVLAAGTKSGREYVCNEVKAAVFILQFYGKLCDRRDILSCGRLFLELCVSMKVARHNELTTFISFLRPRPKSGREYFCLWRSRHAFIMKPSRLLRL